MGVFLPIMQINFTVYQDPRFVLQRYNISFFNTIHWIAENELVH
jgi:hypothetical protein